MFFVLFPRGALVFKTVVFWGNSYKRCNVIVAHKASRDIFGEILQQSKVAKKNRCLFVVICLIFFFFFFAFSFPGYYVLSTVTVSGTGTVVAHVRIRHKPGEGFELEKIQNSGVFNSVEELIDGVAQKLNLRKACPNRKYEYALFEHLQDELRALELAYAGRKGLNESGAGAMELSGDGY